MTGNPRVYVDLDNVLADFDTAFIEKRTKDMKYPQAVYGFYADLEPVPHAIKCFNYLFEKYDVWIATAPSLLNPMSYTEKRAWVEKHLGMRAVDKLIIIPDKSLLEGAVLIDDSEKWEESFKGEFLHFTRDNLGSFNGYPDWYAVIPKLKKLLD